MDKEIAVNTLMPQLKDRFGSSKRTMSGGKPGANSTPGGAYTKSVDPALLETGTDPAPSARRPAGSTGCDRRSSLGLSRATPATTNVVMRAVLESVNFLWCRGPSYRELHAASLILKPIRGRPSRAANLVREHRTCSEHRMQPLWLNAHSRNRQRSARLIARRRHCRVVLNNVFTGDRFQKGLASRRLAGFSKLPNRHVDRCCRSYCAQGENSAKPRLNGNGAQNRR